MKNICLLLLLITISICSSCETIKEDPVPTIVSSIFNEGVKLVDYYPSTQEGDKIYIIELTEDKIQPPLNKFGQLAVEFAKVVNIDDVTMIKVSVISSNVYFPYNTCIPAGPVRAAARGDIEFIDVFSAMIFDCP